MVDRGDDAFTRFYDAEINPPQASVALAYCHGEIIRPAFMRSVVSTIATNRGRNLCGYITSEGLYVPRGRNEIVGQFLSAPECQWLWFLDTDVAFAPDVLGKLLAATEGGKKKIVAAPYWSLGNEGEPYCTWMRVEEGSLLPYLEIPERGTIELTACGMGCTLIHRDVFTDIATARGLEEDPWIWFGHDLVVLDQGPTRLGEDISFCIRAAQSGHITWGVCDIVVDHLKLQVAPRGTVVIDEPTQAS